MASFPLTNVPNILFTREAPCLPAPSPQTLHV